jgi:hypothetical protein
VRQCGRSTSVCTPKCGSRSIRCFGRSCLLSVSRIGAYKQPRQEHGANIAEHRQLQSFVQFSSLYTRMCPPDAGVFRSTALMAPFSSYTILILTTRNPPSPSFTPIYILLIVFLHLHLTPLTPKFHSGTRIRCSPACYLFVNNKPFSNKNKDLYTSTSPNILIKYEEHLSLYIEGIAHSQIPDLCRLPNRVRSQSMRYRS